MIRRVRVFFCFLRRVFKKFVVNYGGNRVLECVNIIWRYENVVAVYRFGYGADVRCNHGFSGGVGFDGYPAKWFRPEGGKDDDVGFGVEGRNLFVGSMLMDGGVEVVLGKVLAELWFHDAVAVDVKVIERGIKVLEGLEENVRAFGFNQ